MSQNVTAPPVQAEAPPATPELLSRCLGSMSLTLKRSDCSFHAAGDPRDWEQSIALMEQAQARGSWEESCSFLRVPFGPLLHTLSFANGRELSNFEVACPPLARCRMCESASKAAVLAALRRVRTADARALAERLEGRSWKQLTGWIGSPPAWVVLHELFTKTAGERWAWRDGWAATDVDVADWFGVSAARGRVVGISLFANGLAGPLPASLGSLANLRELLLQHNALEGEVPPALGQLQRLETLDLGGNALCGTMPPALGRLRRLEYLNLAANKLSGPLPPEVGSLSRLEALHLDRNGFRGPLPEEFGYLSRLENCNLSHNLFEGALPATCARLKALKALFLGHNRFGGRLDCLAALCRGRGPPGDDGDDADDGGALVELYANDNSFDVADLPERLAGGLNVCFVLRNAAAGVVEAKDDDDA